MKIAYVTIKCCKCTAKISIPLRAAQDTNEGTRALAEHDWILSLVYQGHDEALMLPLCRSCAVGVYGEEVLAHALAAVRGAS